MASLCSPQLHSLSSQNCMFINGLGIELRTELGFQLKLNQHRNHHRQLVLTACSTDSVQPSSSNSELNPQNGFNFKKRFDDFQQIVATFPPVVLMMKRRCRGDVLIGFCIATVCLIIAVRISVARRLRDKRPGSVADLVRRGQLRSDRRGITKALKYEDPFNNPLVKVSSGNSSVEMCGKVYRLAPVTLTEQERANHQKRRSRAYQWKRPKVFLKEGDPIPPDVDPDTIRWIPANHPFATTANDIDEELAQSNIYQQHGVPFRIQAEHEALQRKLESLQSEQKLNKLAIDPANAKDFERAYKTQPKSPERADDIQKGQVTDSKPPKPDQGPEVLEGNAGSA